MQNKELAHATLMPYGDTQHALKGDRYSSQYHKTLISQSISTLKTPSICETIQYSTCHLNGQLKGNVWSTVNQAV